VVYEAGKTHARASAPDHAYYAAVKDRKNSKRAALSEARKIVRQACLWHARLQGALPPVMVRGEDAQDLADQIVRWERLNGRAD